MKLIYEDKREVQMYSDRERYTVEVITYITKHKFLFFSWYRIHQNNPKIKNCVYDGEYCSNNKLHSIRNTEKQRAKLWLNKYYNDEKINK